MSGPRSLLPAAAPRGFRLAVLLPAAVLVLAACDMPWEVAGGSGTETSNGEVVAGRVFLGDGPAADAEVFLRPAGFLKDTGGTDSSRAPAPDGKTDKEGFFRLKAMASGPLTAGAYKAEIRDGKGNAVLIGFELTSLDSTLELAPDTLRPVGRLQGRALPDSASTGPLYVQVYGMERLTRTDDTGAFVIPDLPAGQIRFRVLSNRPGISYAAPALAVIAPGSTAAPEPLQPITFANEDYSRWPFSRRIYINTIAAGVADTVRDFPLLVRLDDNRFDFDLSDGKDIRFSTSDGRHLAYQLDSWNAADREAAFWVRMDSVLGNTRQQYIVMHFGRRDAPDFSDGEAVFAGFGAAWHFSEAVDADGAGTFLDASPSRAHGAARISAQDRQGAIGAGAGFRGTHSVVAKSTPAMRPARAFTVSAWAYIKGTGKDGGEFASMGDNYGIRTMPDGDAHCFLFSDTTVKDTAWKANHPFLTTETRDLDLRGNWHLVTGRYDGSAIKIFVDGVERASTAHAKEIQYAFSKEFWMGYHGNGNTPYAFTGSLDEVQTSPVARTAAWIMLAFQTQRPGSTILEFR